MSRYPFPTLQHFPMLEVDISLYGDESKLAIVSFEAYYTPSYNYDVDDCAPELFEYEKLELLEVDGLTSADLAGLDRKVRTLIKQLIQALINARHEEYLLTDIRECELTQDSDRLY